MKKDTNNAGSPAKDPEIYRTPDTPVVGTGKQVVLLIAILAGFITPFDGSAVNIALPAIGAEFHMDAIALSWVATAYLLSSALFLVPFGKIADIYGRKKIFLYGITIFSISSLIMTMASSAEMLIGVRVVQGIGSAMIFGTGVSIVTSVFPPGERGKALGTYITAVYIGLSVGPLLGGAMTQYLGWRSIFFVNVPIGITAIILILWKIKGEWAECRGEKFDLTGSVIYGIAVVSVMYGFSVLPDFKGAALLAMGTLGVIIFALYEIRTPFPVLDIGLLTKNRIFAIPALVPAIPPKPKIPATMAIIRKIIAYLSMCNPFVKISKFYLFFSKSCKLSFTFFPSRMRLTWLAIGV